MYGETDYRHRLMTPLNEQMKKDNDFKNIAKLPSRPQEFQNGRPSLCLMTDYHPANYHA